MSEDGNPHKFTRDVEVENAAVHILDMTPSDVKRTRIAELRELVKTFVESRDSDIGYQTPPRCTPLLNTTQKAVVSDSEMGLYPLQPNEYPTDCVRMFTESIPEYNEDLKGIEYITLPINVNERVKATDGLKDLTNVIHNVLNYATDYENSAREKTQILSTNRSVLDEEDVKWITESISSNVKGLNIIHKWLKAVLLDLERLIQSRLQVEEDMRRIPRGNCISLIQKMHTKTLQMKSIHTVISAKCDCLQIPQDY